MIMNRTNTFIWEVLCQQKAKEILRLLCASQQKRLSILSMGRWAHSKREERKVVLNRQLHSANSSWNNINVRWMAIFRESEPNIDRTKLLASLAQIKSLPPSQCYYCYQCNLLFTESEFNAHSEHPFRKEIHDNCLLEPTRLLTPVDNRKSQAVSAYMLALTVNRAYFAHALTHQQFYFSDSSLQFLVDELTRLEFTRVLCVGAPRYAYG